MAEAFLQAWRVSLWVAREAASEETLGQARVRFLEFLVETGAEGALMEAVEQTLVSATVAEALSQVFKDA